MYRYTKSQFLDFIIPSILFIGLAFLFHQTNLDEWMAGHFYSPEKSWIYRDNFFLEKILHKGGVLFSGAMIIGIGARLFYVGKKAELKKERDYLAFVLTSTLLTIILISWLKKWTTLPCPWNTTAFGGAALTPPLWKMFSSEFSRGHCFPAGHSSAGYAFLSLYFSYTLVYGKRNFLTLIPGILIGLVFGITQQVRGAHFISHDFITIFLSIFMCWVTYFVYSIYNKIHEV